VAEVQFLLHFWLWNVHFCHTVTELHSEEVPFPWFLPKKILLVHEQSHCCCMGWKGWWEAMANFWRFYRKREIIPFFGGQYSRCFCIHDPDGLWWKQRRPMCCRGDLLSEAVRKEQLWGLSTFNGGEKAGTEEEVMEWRQSWGTKACVAFLSHSLLQPCSQLCTAVLLGANRCTPPGLSHLLPICAARAGAGTEQAAALAGSDFSIFHLDRQRRVMPVTMKQISLWVTEQ